jgi:hypothetical protein
MTDRARRWLGATADPMLLGAGTLADGRKPTAPGR